MQRDDWKQVRCECCSQEARWDVWGHDMCGRCSEAWRHEVPEPPRPASWPFTTPAEDAAVWEGLRKATAAFVAAHQRLRGTG